MLISATVRSAQNESKPVNRLPPEILIKVFEFRRWESDLLAATHVNARWREILTSTPHLWSEISDFYSTGRMNLYLERSNPVLLDVTIRNGTKTSLVELFPRMRSLCIQARNPGEVKEIVSLLDRKAPNIQSLEIESSFSPAEFSGSLLRSPHTFLGGYAPSLQSLTFRRVSAGFVPAFPLPKLTHIDWVTETEQVAINEVLGLFRSSPLIEVIKMHVKVKADRYQSLKTVTLSKLRKLDWADHAGAISLIPYLIAPQLSELAIKVTQTSEDQTFSLSSIPPSDVSHIPLLLKPKGLEYVYENCNRSWYFSYHGSASFVIRTGALENRGSLFSPDIPISFSEARKLTVEAIGGSPPFLDIPIEQFKSLQRVELRGETGELASRIMLASPPQLSKIRIASQGHDFSFNGLAEGLRKKREAGHGEVTVRIFGGNLCKNAGIETLEKVAKVIVGS